MRLLLLGSNGQVGWELRRSLAPLGEVIALDVNDPPGAGVDLSQPESLALVVERYRPEVIVNAAAYTAVDKAETDHSFAAAVNAGAPAVLASAARKLDAMLVHYSTDYVFDGSGQQQRRESDQTGPLSVYGRTKLEGEEAIVTSGARHLILRTSWVYAVRGHNFIKTMLKLAQERDELKVIDDQIGAPTGAELLADVTSLLIRSRAAGLGQDGIYHCVASGETSWFGLAKFVIDWARDQGIAVKVPPEALHPITTVEYPTPAQRPLNSRLSTEKLSRTFDLAMPPWQHGVERMLRELCNR